MDGAWIGAISALSGVAIGTAADALRTRWAFRREKVWGVWEQERRHLEMVYEAVEQVRERPTPPGLLIRRMRSARGNCVTARSHR